MGQRYSTYFGSSDAWHTQSDTVRASQMKTEECDTTYDNTTSMKNTASHKQDNQSNACSSSAAVSADTVHNVDNTSSSTSAASEHLQWFVTHMNEEHWERLNMMCIVSPSSS